MAKSRSRHMERSRAFQVLYALHFNELKSESELRTLFESVPNEDETESSGFAWELVSGVWKNSAKINELIEKNAHNWRMDRIGKVELTLLRLAMYELVFYGQTPSRVVINEALELIASFGDDKSKSFVNGILDAVAKEMQIS